MKADEYRYWQSRPAYERMDAVAELILSEAEAEALWTRQAGRGYAAPRRASNKSKMKKKRSAERRSDEGRPQRSLPLSQR
jgi:hypothetical protein